MTDIVLIFSKTNRFPLMSRNNNYWRVMLSAHFVLAKILVILKAITKRICFYVQCQLASLARKRKYFACICQKPTTRGSRTTSLPFVDFCHFCVPLLFFFLLQLFNSFLFLFLYLSILTISFLFLVISIVRPRSCFYRFFFSIFVIPIQRPEVNIRPLHLLLMTSSARNARITPFVHPCDILKEHSAHLVLLALLQWGS